LEAVDERALGNVVVIPAEAGIHCSQMPMDPRFRWGDGLFKLIDTLCEWGRGDQYVLAEFSGNVILGLLFIRFCEEPGSLLELNKASKMEEAS
jgi:ATP/ADP translocase